MTKIDHDELQRLVGELYGTVRELEAMFPGRYFTPDGHMVGSLGECLVADAYGLTLLAASNKGHDALTTSGVRVEIKATQGDRVAFRSEPEHAIVVRLLPDGSFEEVYNGPGSLVWEQVAEAQAEQWATSAWPVPLETVEPECGGGGKSA